MKFRDLHKNQVFWDVNIRDELVKISEEEAHVSAWGEVFNNPLTGKPISYFYNGDEEVTLGENP